jgi:hypothetical protein
MTCAQASELLAAFAGGGLEGREHDAVAGHVRGCAACVEEVRVLREILGDTRRLAAPPMRDETFWHDMARDIRVAVTDQEKRRRFFWWRLPALGFAFALAAAAVLWVYVRGQPTFAPGGKGGRTIAAHAPRPLPDSFLVPDVEDVDDLDADQLSALNASLSGDDVPPGEDELATANAAAAENLVDSLDDADLTRVATAL